MAEILNVSSDPRPPDTGSSSEGHAGNSPIAAVKSLQDLGPEAGWDDYPFLVEDDRSLCCEVMPGWEEWPQIRWPLLSVLWRPFLKQNKQLLQVTVLTGPLLDLRPGNDLSLEGEDAGRSWLVPHVEAIDGGLADPEYLLLHGETVLYLLLCGLHVEGFQPSCLEGQANIA